VSRAEYLAHVDVLDDHDRDLVERTGYGRRMGLGESPALLVVDTTYEFCGRTPMPTALAVTKQRRACGDTAWTAVAQIERLLQTARQCGIPVVYSVSTDPAGADHDAGLWYAKNYRAGDPGDTANPQRPDNRIVDKIAPAGHERVFAKDKPSMFYGTSMLPYLTAQRVDSVVICGGTTSGCVYATAVDAFSANLRVATISDACFDRFQLPHKAFLLDIDLKYGDVMTCSEWVSVMTRL
jgi:maleamate amidohydrolase